MYGFTSRSACPLLKPGLPSFALQQALLVKPNQELPAARTAYHTHLATQESVFHPARHLRFHTKRATQAPPSQLERGRQK